MTLGRQFLPIQHPLNLCSSLRSSWELTSTKKKIIRFYSAILIIDSGTSLTRSDAVSCCAEMIPVCSINQGNSLQWKEENLLKLSLCKCPCGLFKEQLKPWCHVCAAIACSQVSGCFSGG